MLRTAMARLGAAALVVTSAAALATSCGGDDTTGAEASTCSLGGEHCKFGCDHSLGCVQCITGVDCGSATPFCVLGECAQCSTNADCGTVQVCWPREHQC